MVKRHGVDEVDPKAGESDTSAHLGQAKSESVPRNRVVQLQQVPQVWACNQGPAPQGAPTEGCVGFMPSGPFGPRKVHHTRMHSLSNAIPDADKVPIWNFHAEPDHVPQMPSR